jgi:hypothetical protein
MELAHVAEGVLQGEITPVSCPTEADWYAAWLEHGVGSQEDIVTAALGGALSDRLAWVFLAGYQAMIRRCFSDLPPERGWCSFVNTEDASRSLPGTTLTGEPGNRRLSGWKTWVAAADHVERLLVSSSQGEAPFVVVRRDQPGVRIETAPPKAYLSELAQGRVELADVAVSEDRILGDQRTFAVLRSSESAFVRLSLNAFMFSHACRLGGPPALIGEALSGLLGAAAVLQLPLPSDAAAVAMLGADVRTRALARDFEAFIEEHDSDLHRLWMKDRRLAEGASAGITTRAEAALNRVS